MRKVFCQLLNKEAEGLAFMPYPGPLGQRIFDNISKEAWNLWLKQQIIIINENRLQLHEKSAQELLAQEMEKFLFKFDL